MSTIASGQYKTELSDKLIACLNNEKFQSEFKICKEKDTVYENTRIYNNSNFDLNNLIADISCGKRIEIVQSNIDISKDAQRVRGMCRLGKIVLYHFEKIKSQTYTLYFIDTCTNYAIGFEVDEENKVTIIMSGSF
jgi:hypothetical protein